MRDPACRLKLIVCVVAPPLAFAGNSLLCRMALGSGAIDAASFTGLRLGSGALVLILVLRSRSPSFRPAWRLHWWPALALFGYAAAFSFAYLSLPTGVGALVLFGAVQLTMFGGALRGGEHPGRRETAGTCIAFSGLIYLVSPGLAAPSPRGVALMVLAGICWGVYSLQGRRVSAPLAATTVNFLSALPFALLLLVFVPERHLTVEGGLLALASGGLASGLGYVIWYAAVPQLSATRAAIVQLAVPVLAAGGGILMLSEPLTLRLVLSALGILGGIALALNGKKRTPRKEP